MKKFWKSLVAVCVAMVALAATAAMAAENVTVSGSGSATLDSGVLTVTPREGWYVDSVEDAAGNALTVEEAGGTVACQGDTATVTFKQYAAKFESADGGEAVYTKTLSAAAQMAKADEDRITLLRNVDLNANDSINSVYRLQLEQGFILDLNGMVLTTDKSLVRFMYKTADTPSTLTIRNGTLVAAVNDTAQHMFAVMNEGSVVLENVDAYNGAFYTDGQIVVNQAEVDKSSSGVSGVIICNGSGDIYITDCYLCTFGNYYVFNTNNTDDNLPKCELFLKNSHLKTHGAKVVVNCSDGREYNVNFLDGQSVLTTTLSANGAFHEAVNVVAYSGFDIKLNNTYTEGGKTFYDYAQIGTYAVTWVDQAGNVLEEDMVAGGLMPEYNGLLPQKDADDNNTYVFSGWSPAVTPANGAATYTAQFRAAPADYAHFRVDMVEDADLYRVQGRPYLTGDGLYMDFAGAAIEFEAAFAGGLTISYDAQEPVYLEVAVDGVAREWVYLPEGEDQTVILEKFVTPGTHQVRIVRDSDVSTKGEQLKITAIAFTGKKQTMQPTAQRQLYIEFVGDSITSGKYTVMENEAGIGIHKATNSYAYKVAQLLNADYSMISRGGCGYFRVTTCPQPAHKLYPYYNGFLEEPVEYTTQRKADVVILALGTNDSKEAVENGYTDGVVPFTTFQQAPTYVIEQIRQMHGQDVKIVLLHNMMSSSWEEELREVAKNEGVYFLQVTKDRTGGNNHPSAAGHTVIAGELQAFLEETVLADVRVCDENDRQGQRYYSLQGAVDALQPGEYIRLVENIAEDAVIRGDVYVELNGFTLSGNLSGDGTLYGMDTSGDDFTLPAGSIRGNITCNVAGNFKTDVTGSVKRYLAVADSKGYSFHRIYLAITHMSLRPERDGVGYKAVFAADDVVRSMLSRNEAYGFTLWVGEDGSKYSVAKSISTFRSGKGVSLWLQNFDVENYGQTDVYGQVFLKLQDGTVIESTVVSYTLRSMLETVAAQEADLTDTQRAAVRAMVARFADAMKDWLIDALR